MEQTPSTLKSAFAKVKAVLMRRGQSAHEAEDLMQEAWLRCSRAESVGRIRRPEAFLIRAAINLSIDGYRASAKWGEQAMLEEELLVDCAPSVEAVLLARERVARLSVCLGRLTDRTRDILLAHRIEGKTYREIAKEYKMTVSGVERHIAKAMLQLTSGMEGW
jgi:RNA polymerase sigma factor (sigma-70 family)